MEKLMEVRYQDEAQKISLTCYADTLIMDSQQGKLVGIRVGGAVLQLRSHPGGQ